MMRKSGQEVETSFPDYKEAKSAVFSGASSCTRQASFKNGFKGGDSFGKK